MLTLLQVVELASKPVVYTPPAVHDRLGVSTMRSWPGAARQHLRPYLDLHATDASTLRLRGTTQQHLDLETFIQTTIAGWRSPPKYACTLIEALDLYGVKTNPY